MGKTKTDTKRGPKPMPESIKNGSRAKRNKYKRRKITMKRNLEKKPQGKTYRSALVPLSQSQFLAVEYFLQGKSKSEALLLAGYSKSTALKNPMQVFNHPLVVAAIEERREAMVKRADNIIDRIMDEYARIAFFNIGTILEVTEEGDFIFDFRDATLDEFAAIGEITVETYREGKGRDAETVKRVKVKPYDKKGALDSLAKIHNLLAENVNLNDGGMSLEERIAAGRKRIAGPRVVEGDYEVVE